MNRLFPYWCFAAAALFSIVALRAMMLEEFGLVVILPSVLCILLVITGMRSSGGQDDESGGPTGNTEGGFV